MSVAEIDLVVERLDVVINETIRSGSRAGYFAAMYRKVTLAVRDAIIAGRFAEATEWRVSTGCLPSDTSMPTTNGVGADDRPRRGRRHSMQASDGDRSPSNIFLSV